MHYDIDKGKLIRYLAAARMTAREIRELMDLEKTWRAGKELRIALREIGAQRHGKTSGTLYWIGPRELPRRSRIPHWSPRDEAIRDALRVLIPLGAEVTTDRGAALSWELPIRVAGKRVWMEGRVHRVRCVRAASIAHARLNARKETT